MAKVNLQTKIVLYTVGVVVVMIMAFTGTNLWLDYSATRAQFRDHISDLAIGVAPTVRSDLQYRRIHELRRTVRSFSYLEEIVRIDILGPDFENLTASNDTRRLAETFRNFDVEPSGRLPVRVSGQNIAALAPVKGELGEVLGYVHVLAANKAKQLILREKLARGLIIGGIFGICGCLVGFYAGKRLTRPLVRLIRAAEDMASGRVPGKIESRSGDELGQLTKSFNKMVQKRREAELSVERSRQHLLFILRETPLGYIEWDLDFHVVSWNKAAERIFGFTEGDAMGRHALELIVPDEQRHGINKVWNRIVSGEAGKVSLNQNVRADGCRIMCHWNNTVIRNPDGSVKAVASLVNDVTQNIEAQEQMRQAMETAQKATMAKSDFLANMSHEIRTPMNGVIGLTELLLESELDSQQRSYLEVIHSSGEMLLTIINDILDLSKIESGKLELTDRNFNLQDSLANAFQLFSKNLQKKGLSSHVELDESLPRMVNGDPVRLRQIIYNLISNAVKFTEEGSISMKARAEIITPQSVQLYVTIADTGTGINPDCIDLVFQPFAQGDSSSTRSFVGTGLGLTICRRLCNMMRGDIQIDFTSPQGTQFTFNIALKIASEEQGLSPLDKIIHAHPEPANIPNLEILLVENNAINRLVTKRILGRIGFKCASVTNGREAVEYVERHHCDLIFMDLQMPVMDGFAATRLIRLNNKVPQPVIVALTASAVEGDRQRCLDAGMDDYLPKPINIKLVKEVISRLSPRLNQPV